MFTRLWNDETGSILSIEIILVGTILGIGVITGLTSLRDGIITELADVGAAIGALDQTYQFGASTGHCSTTNGTSFQDANDFCDLADTGGAFANSRCLVVCTQDTPGEGNSTNPVP